MGGFAFSIPGGLGKPFYERLRQLRQKHGLTDRALIECMIWYVLSEDLAGVPKCDFKAIVETYKATAPSDTPTLPEVP